MSGFLKRTLPREWPGVKAELTEEALPATREEAEDEGGLG